MRTIQYTPNKYNDLLCNYLEKYQDTKKVIPINIRDIVSDYKSSDYYSHLIHPYPAKLLMHIPRFFLENTILTKENDLVLDPFCGSGTVLLESLLCKRDTIGVDSNPLARLISNVKTTHVNEAVIKDTLNQLIIDVKPLKTSYHNVTNIDYWYSENVKYELQGILEQINKLDNSVVKNFFLVCFSKCAGKLSYSDPRISVPVKLNSNKKQITTESRNKIIKQIEFIDSLNVKDTFIKIVNENSQRINTIVDIQNKSKLTGDNSLKMSIQNPLCKGTAQMIITSPPYVGAQKYIRASSISLGWLGYLENERLTNLKDNSIGREFYKKNEYTEFIKTEIHEANIVLKKIRDKNPLRAHISANYLNEMSISIKEMKKMLKPGGYLVLVSGNNTVSGIDFMTSEYLKTLVESNGLICLLELKDDIRSRGLMTRRNRTANIISSETIHIFKKA